MPTDIVKTVHLACAALSLAGFLLRGLWMWHGSRLLHARATRILPHVNDSLLFGAGLWLLIATGQYAPLPDWLLVKLVAIVVYILLGMVALKRGRTAASRGTAFVAALGVFGYIVTVALTRSPWPF
jgi:uncharacterized membrane protein SirB2